MLCIARLLKGSTWQNITKLAEMLGEEAKLTGCANERGFRRGKAGRVIELKQNRDEQGNVMLKREEAVNERMQITEERNLETTASAKEGEIKCNKLVVQSMEQSNQER